MTINKSLSGFHPVSHDRPLLEQGIDAYRMKGKLSEPTVCPKCNAYFMRDVGSGVLRQLMLSMKSAQHAIVKRTMLQLGMSHWMDLFSLSTMMRFYVLYIIKKNTNVLSTLLNALWLLKSRAIRYL